MGLASEFLATETQLIEGACGEVAVVLGNDRECAPERIGLERHDDVDAGTALDVGYELQIAAKTIFIDNECRCWELIGGHVSIVDDCETGEFEE